ncbi:MAG: hypothetical protein AAF614_20485 [Chloroflexota bacterium]
MMVQTVNTGEILDAAFDPTAEYTTTTQELDFTTEQHHIWRDLYRGIYQPQLLAYVCQEYLDGLEMLALDPQHIPTVAHLNGRISSRTGWRVERTAVRYTKADAWYDKFAQRIFLITDYLRSREQMVFTPEPDIFHDIFGHLPYLTQPFYAAIEDKFAPAYKKATDVEREVIKRLAWYSTEFGLVMEENAIKVFGAGLISGQSELNVAITEIERLANDGVIDPGGDVYEQICDNFYRQETAVKQLIDGINRLHQQGEMSSDEKGWNVINDLFAELSIKQTGYFGGNVLIAPFDLDIIATIPKTVYAMNPIYFVFKSFADLDKMLENYLGSIAAR